MRALVIGGTRFVGAAIVDELCRRGAAITVFSRGETNPERTDGLDAVRGDRATDLGRLGDRRFDAIFDSCGYVPDAIAPSAERAAAGDAFYVFVSSASAYARSDAPLLGEDAALATVDPGVPIDDVGNYGAAKVLCEQTLAGALGDRLAILRAGLIVGPGDYTDRFPYWVARFDRPGPIVCPGDGDDPLQLIDARDLARFAVDLAEARRGGAYNTTGPTAPATFADLVDAVDPDRERRGDLRWAPAPFLADRRVRPWVDMPCWLPRDHESASIVRLDLSRAIDAGLVTRPLAETAADTRAWLADQARSWPLDCGLDSERERALLEALEREG